MRLFWLTTLTIFILAFPVALRNHDSIPFARQEPTPTPAAGLQFDGPTKCDIGELVRFDARQSEVDEIVWTIQPDTRDFEVIEEGRRAFFSAREPGEFLISIAGAREGRAFIYHHRITVRGEPTPATGLTRRIIDWFGDVDSPQKIAEARTLAESFRTLAEAAGADIPVEKVIEATRAANRRLLGESLDPWKPFLTNLGAALDAKLSAGELQTSQQYKAVWLQIAEGLDLAAKR